MKAGITVAELLHGLADVAEPLAGAEVTGLSLDSRSVQPGGAFVAVDGLAAHGHDLNAWLAGSGMELSWR